MQCAHLVCSVHQIYPQKEHADFMECGPSSVPSLTEPHICTYTCLARDKVHHNHHLRLFFILLICTISNSSNNSEGSLKSVTRPKIMLIVWSLELSLYKNNLNVLNFLISVDPVHILCIPMYLTF